MFRTIFVLLALLGSNILVFATTALANESQQWECAINLHQGDNGTLSIERLDDDVSGKIVIKRNDSIFENEVSGRWLDNEINLKRLLGDSSNDDMVGVVIATGTKTVKIGGRFSAQYQGVWSADCDLVSSSSIPNEESQSGSNAVEPSTSVGVIPNNPSSNERVKFSARASHPDGIASVSFFLGDKKIHSCNTETCDISYGPLSKGKYSWHVEATSKSGATNTRRNNELVVSTPRTAGVCQITGQATGTAAKLSGIYLVKLYGPNNNALKASKEFSEGRYEFNNLPVGRYTISVDTGADQAVLATPSSTLVNCAAQGNITVDFDFR